MDRPPDSVSICRIFPTAAEFRFHLGNILGKRGDFASAEEMYLQAISISDRDKAGDDLSLYHSNLGVLYHRYVRHLPFTEMGRWAWLFA